MYSSAERAHLLKKDLKQSSTLRVLLLCLGLIVVTMGSVTLSMGAMLGPPLLVGPGLCLTLGGMLCLGTSIYFGLKQHHINKQQKSASSAQSVSSRKVSVVIRPSLPSVVELSDESFGSTVSISENSCDDDSAFVARNERPPK
ncbi:uncharacterized protein LOC111268912 isoform X1 [Varroa jacobsoni]|uniref:uncharacterized protein LOC111268912 isoform X1 n=1 Tax=Varroa jacobsoni TaxID=62625 RepID=UPI000BF513DC|nr:uncharacterized protein LOC111268912 isoform X1 [Varroa jacobsoni]XP_022703880.1 uncharacterized protein LOC111268912 isoform X1 [Varroa jacobsoni]XP_022703881.1 uncharacterized protein LOC111268912 isoform X1 [Varroa jacobsoni]XP_022703882.1 uncharacterized protein LOC111268912 isoform X1 [Varroa jacobsoni]